MVTISETTFYEEISKEWLFCRIKEGVTLKGCCVEKVVLSFPEGSGCELQEGG